MNISIKIKRFNPEKDREPYFQTYPVTVAPTDRLLDALMHIKRFQDGSLAFRKSCAHGVCGSDAMRINGKDGLACKTLIQDVVNEDGAAVVLEPLRYFPVQRDLIVDQTAFFDKYKSIKPFLINDEAVEEKERLQSPEERRLFDDATNCILCASCFSACPIPENTPAFLGPAAIAQASRFNDDSRDRGFELRLPVLNADNGVWPCQNHFECTRACPREIKITKLINQTKRRIKALAQTEE
ncbi:MAG: succinate dehydrogenase iron-sulfur subunit [Deltaproteobacteria bacterium]|jgi:succinate dehydrogenase / fumarate reductase iron-sulfur subunit|nr:succinate dehydrogenase iron-sulfur subunit [Deltaproteobacteria bacterium]